MQLWCIKDRDVWPVYVVPVVAGKHVTGYRDETGINYTYSPKHIRTWGELTAPQKAKAYRNAYQFQRNDALYDIALDPSLESQYPSRIKQLKEERDRAIEALNRGEDVAPPRLFWE